MSVTVRLNGSNYVSEKRRQAFEKALAEGHQIQPPAPSLAPENSAHAAPSPEPVSAPITSAARFLLSLSKNRSRRCPP